MDYIAVSSQYSAALASPEKLQQEFLATLENISDGIFACDAEWRFVYLNASAERVLGIKRDEVLGKSHWEVFPLTPGTRLEDEYRRAAAGETRDFENFYQPWQRWFHNRCFPRKGGGMMVCFQDITERKQQELEILRLKTTLEEKVAERTLELRASEDRFRALVETTSDCIWEVDDHGRFTYVSPRFEELLGYAPEQMLGKTPADFMLADEAPSDLDDFRFIIRNQAFESIIECRHRHRNGSMVFAEVNGRAFYGDNGAFLGIRGVTRDITARKQLEKEREQYFILFNTSADLMTVFDMATERFKLVNPAFSEITGYTEQELLEKKLDELVHADDLARTIEAIQSKPDENVVRGFENRYICKDGSLKWLSWQSVRDYASGLIYATARDCTKRKLAEEKIRNSEERFRQMFVQHSAIMLLIDPSTGSIIDANQAATSFYGYTRNRFRSMYITEISALPSDEVQKYIRQVEEEKDKIFIYPHRRSDGTIRTVEVRSSPIISNGRPLLFSIIHDITAKKELEDALMLAKATVDAVSDCVHWLTPDAYILDANPAMCHALGYSRDELLRMNILDIDPHFDCDRYKERRAKLMAGGSLTFETEHRAKDGRLIPVEVSVSHVQVGAEERICAIARDISKRLKYEQELLAAQKAAEEASQAKSRFLSMMSHEIRTPMNGLMGLIQLLLTTGLTLQQQGYATQALNAGNELVQLLNGILDLAKIEANKLELESYRFCLRELVGETVRLMELAAHEKDLLITTTVDQAVPDVLEGDAMRLRQVLTNLLSNAVKFTREGSISLVVNCAAEDAAQATLCFEVRDTGIGMSADKMRAVFSPFVQGDNSTTRRYGGTGLGLSICKDLIELMGGAISVESTEGKGSIFRFTVVMGKQQAATAQENAMPALSVQTTVPLDQARYHILLAEDDLRAQEIVAQMLEMHGYTVDVAVDGREVLQALEREDYDIVLMDCMMPEMDGYKTTAAIRSAESSVKNHNIPIIALTGNAMKQDVECCLAVGMDDHLPKPLMFDELMIKLKKWLA